MTTDKSEGDRGVMKIIADYRQVKVWRFFCPKCDKQINTTFGKLFCDCGLWKFDNEKNNYVMEKN